MNKKVPRIILVFFNCFFLITLLNAQPIIKVDDEKAHFSIGKSIAILVDESDSLNIHQLLSAVNQKRFLISKQEIPSIGVTNAALWCRLKVINKTSEDCFVEISNAALDSISIYDIISPDSIKVKIGGTFINFNDREVLNNNFIFKLCRTTDTIKTYYIRIRHSRGTQFQIQIGTFKGISEFTHQYDFLQGIYFGVMLLMIFYNLFIYFSVRDDISYIYYVLYGICMALLNSFITGYGFEYLWPNHAIINNYEDVVTGCVGISGILFAMNFLQTKDSSPIMHKIFKTFIIVFSISIVIVFFKYTMLATIVIELFSLLLIICFFITAFKLLKQKEPYKPAKFFLFAWSILLLCVFLFILKDFNLVPYNVLTVYSLQIGSACEALLLSFALADKINIYKQLILDQNLRQNQFDELLLKTQLETQEQTLKHISREIHDSVGSTLSSAKMFLGSMQNPHNAVIVANETLGQAIKELRSLSKSLDEQWLKQFNFIENLTIEINRINKSDRLHIYFFHPELLPLKPELQIVLFRIVQELLHNAIKHAGAKNIKINITLNDVNINIIITDDGKGFDIGKIGLDGSGISNVKNRTQLLGGTVEWQSESGSGTTIIFALPL